ncbi:hypothetical protein EDB85DRAFT_1886676 [Lactarius pseudohatsudake]|nr:hypothetical protein EDB85DRAFT_1886676 [Lactarius pseudohatsudake]
MTAIPVTGPGDPAPVSRENDGQTDPARKGTDNDVEMRDRDLETPLFLPSSEGTSSEPPIRQRDRDRDHDLLDIISIDSSSSSSRPPPQRSPRKAKKQRGQEQLMAYILVPPLPPGALKSDYMPVQQRSRTRQRQTAVKGKARAGDNAGSKELVHVLQVAFENNWPGAGSTGPSGQKTKKAAKETVVVVDDEDDEDEESDKSKIPTPLDQALAAAFTHDSTNPNVVASASAPAATTTRRSAKETRAEASNGSASVEVAIPLPTKRAQSTPPPQEQSSPITPPDVNSLAGLPLTILHEPARTEIAIPPRALSHLHSSPDPPDPVRRLQETQQYAIRQGFCYEGAAVSAHSLLATSPAAEPSPVSNSGACAITTNSASTTDPDDLQDASLDLDLDLEAGPADAHGVEDDVVPPPPPLLRTAGTHDHTDGPMLGFVIPEHDGVDHSPGAGVDIGRALTSPTQGPSFDLASPNRGGEGSIDWRAGNVFGGAGASTDTGAGEYAGNGTIDPSVLGGGGGSNLSPGRLGDDVSSQIRGFGGVQPSRATDEDNEEEEDVMGMLFENTSDDDFMPPSGLGKGKGRAVVVDGIVELSESVAAAAGSRMRRKSWRMELADEAEVGENNDSDDESEDDDETHPASSSSGVLPGGLTLCHHRRSTTRRPKMRCTLIKASTEMRCRNLFCDRCIENRYPQLTFDRAAEDFECPACRNYCNCSLCSRMRGEAYIPERNGGWRSWIARQGGSHRPAPIPAKKSKSNNLGTTPAATKTTEKPVIMTTTTTTDAEVFDGSWSATAVFTVSGEPLGSAFLQGNKARIVPVSQPTASPTAATTTPSAPPSFASSPIPEPTQEQQQSQRRQHAFIGKPRKTWGRLVALPDPDHDQPEQQKKKTKTKGKTAGRERRDGNPGEGGDADADPDADDGIWPGEYVVSVPSAQTEDMATRITLEEMERAIGAAFAIGGEAQSSSSLSSM